MFASTSSLACSCHGLLLFLPSPGPVRFRLAAAQTDGAVVASKTLTILGITRKKEARDELAKPEGGGKLSPHPMKIYINKVIYLVTAPDVVVARDSGSQNNTSAAYIVDRLVSSLLPAG